MRKTFASSIYGLGSGVFKDEEDIMGWHVVVSINKYTPKLPIDLRFVINCCRVIFHIDDNLFSETTDNLVQASQIMREIQKIIHN